MSGGSVFVTGADGLLGSWLVRALLDRGAQVTVLRRGGAVASALTLEGTERRVNVVPGDVGDAAVIGRALDENEVDTVFHLAAQSIASVATAGPVATFESNVRGTWVVLEACRRHGVRRVVVAASVKVYGGHEDPPYREDFALMPRYPYDVSKAAADMIARSYWHSYGLPVAVTRCSNLYGGGDLNLSRLVPDAVTAAIGARRPVIRSDGTSQRDFLYVEDAVAAYLAVCDLLPEGGGAGEAFNAGGDRPHAVLDIVRRVCEIAGSGMTPEVRGTGTAPGETVRQWVDSSKLRAATGWAPQVDLDEGLRRTVGWYRRHRDEIGY
jgi:CDP-glucose 4,6-dehydratase